MQIEIGSVYDGTVTGLTSFGAFVKLEDGTTGMVHISEVASEYVTDITQHLSQGDSVKVKVIEINEKGKVGLSIKKALPEPEKHKQQKRSYNAKGGSRGWKGNPSSQEQTGSMSFEDMMARFKAQSDEKMSDLKRNTDKRGGNRRGGKQ